MTWNKLILAALVTFIVFLAAFPFVFRASIRNRYQPQIYGVGEAPDRPVAIVFGAAVNRGGWLSTVLRDRMDTAISLHKSGIVGQIIVSGHQDDLGYDEPGSMRAYAIARGIPPSEVQMDTRGDRTYDTCYRAQHEYHLDSVLLVTQDFHLPRALFTCSNLGIEAVGVRADMRIYRGASWYELRETAATLVALADLFRREAPDKSGTTASIK
ncbi:MAG: ElyC/SanA/YdcF family protein [Candidatus Promineifilaceae bacterium]